MLFLLSSLDTFVPLYQINILARNCHIYRGVIKRPYPVHDLKENAFSVSPLSMMLDVRRIYVFSFSFSLPPRYSLTN